MPARPDEVLTMGVELDAKAALQQMQRFEREMRKEMQIVSKAVGNLGKLNKKGLQEAVKGSNDWLDGLEDVATAHDKQANQLDRISQIIEGLRKHEKAAVGERKKGISETIKLLEKQSKTTKAAAGGMKGGRGGGRGGRGGGGAWSGVKEGGKEAFSSFLGKDLKGVVGGLAKVMGSFGPMLSVASSVLAGLIKLFIDAEATAKQFQKDILTSASNAEFLAKAGGNAEAAFADMEDTVSQIRDAAFSLENLKWGISAEEHKQVVNVLTQEGVSLVRIRQEAEAGGKSVKEFASELTHVSVAYSRAFGVPLQEINQMQAEMMTEMGMSLNETKLSFSQMTRAATESGIASNKFFAMIRGVSQDLSLYNTRLEDAVKTLKLLGKVMNPREAQKFMQTAMQGLKQMGRQQRLQLTLLAGPGKMKGLVDRDLKSKAELLGEKVKMTGADVLKIMSTKGAAGLEEQIAQLPDEAQGAVRGMATDIQLQMKRAGKGVFGVSGAAAGLSPAAALEAMQTALVNFGGGKKLSDIVGTIGGEMMAENLGISQDQLDAMAKFEGAIDMQRVTLKKQLKSGTKEQIDRLQKAGLSTAEDIDKAGYDKIYSAMDDGTKKELDQTAKVEDLAKKQSDLTSSLLDKLGMLVDFMMNQFYDLVLDIYKILPWAGDKADLRKQAQALGAGKKELTQVSGAGDFNKAMAGTKLVAVMNDVFDKMDNAQQHMLTSADFVRDITRFKEAKARGESGVKPGTAWSKADEEQLHALEKERAAIEKVEEASMGITQKLGDTFSPEDWADALKQAKVDESTIQKFLEASKAHGDRAAVEELDPGQTRDAMRKLVTWSQASKGRKMTGMGQVAEVLSDTGVYSETTAEATKETAEKLKETDSIAVKFGPIFLAKYKKTMEEVLLDSIRKALFEFYMYSDTDRTELAKTLKEGGGSIPDLAKQIGENAMKGGVGLKAPGALEDEGEAKKNQKGGLIAGVSGGLAVVRAAAGEGLASVAPGERIIPAGAGGGGGPINVNVNGVGGNDLAKVIHAKVVDGIAEYKRRERFQ